MFELETFDLAKYDEVISRGLSCGVGDPDGQVCIEAAICIALGLPHGDDPGCVSEQIRAYKISLNDKTWSSEQARASGLRDLGIAQLGSLGVVNGEDFAKRLAELTIKVLIPTLFRDVFTDEKCLAAAYRCEVESTQKSILNALSVVNALEGYTYPLFIIRSFQDALWYASHSLFTKCSIFSASTAANANYIRYEGDPDKYLKLSASLALQVLHELGSPGCQLL